MNFNFNFMEFLKLPTKIMVALGFFSGVILFLPDSIVEKIYMIEFRDKYGFVIGVIFILTASILITTGIIAIYNYFKNKYVSKKVEENSGKFLASLDTFKKAIVFGLYVKEDHTEVLPLNNGAIAHLEHMMVIGKATNQYFIDDLNNPVFPYMLQPWVIEKLNNDYKLLTSFKEAYRYRSSI
ncbi:MAG: superinfection exclusion B family protein [Clostridium sp.]|uniref:superinfection exclusion B family protein n=1 Tax=Clostridium sp. TaxID=1506 RepID=UPI002A918BEE|nr:superinfection exclusion B family protein [Clostridium sp.]MDY6228801.1 superinfection exclusion B family protein [Clostridium sp.]